MTVSGLKSIKNTQLINMGGKAIYYPEPQNVFIWTRQILVLSVLTEWTRNLRKHLKLLALCMYSLNDVMELNFINTPKFQLSPEEQTYSNAAPELKWVEVSGREGAREGGGEKPSPEEPCGVRLE